MRFLWRPAVVAVALVTASGLALGAASASTGARSAARPAHGAATYLTVKSGACITGRLLCTELQNSYPVFGDRYVGHDEPSVLYYSNKNGAGYRNQWQLTLPTEPPPSVVPGRSWDFELTPAIWFGMAMCDSQSYPEQVSTCTPDSDSNIVAPAHHAGTAFTELQFYPPGWVSQFNSQSCDPHDWCAALNIDSLSENPINGTTLNPTCQSQILGGTEYVNFAFLTKDGKPVGPPNPLDFNPATSGNPAQPDVLFMRPGDKLVVTMKDTAHGLKTEVRDRTTGVTGFMTASAANGFGQIQYAPTGTSCTEIPYDFHPMYATSSPQTRVLWTAHSYNVAFAEEIGHFDLCSNVDAATFSCTGLEGPAGDQEPTDGDDTACFPASASLLVQVSGCNGANAPGFDGMSYIKDWPDGNTYLHPTPQLFTSPLTGREFNKNYSQVAFEADTARIEAADFGGTCSTVTGVGCTLTPPTDDGQPIAFYPFYSITSTHDHSVAKDGEGGCRWFIGNDVPGLTASDFGGVSQFGTLFAQQFLAFGGGGTFVTRLDDYQQLLPNNPCPARH
ncbi:MAG TPA: hypothetical protein VN840_03410 [Streptosporangiaceae bacterium]|nr:hypothetical protein [Streptosporangiaceae bacterium]